MKELGSMLVLEPKHKASLGHLTTRKFIKDGEVLMQLGRKRFQECHVFLLSGVLLITTEQDEDRKAEGDAEHQAKVTADASTTRYLVKVVEQLSDNTIECSALPEVHIDKTLHFPLRLHFPSLRKEYRWMFSSLNERDAWLWCLVDTVAASPCRRQLGQMK